MKKPKKIDDIKSYQKYAKSKRTEFGNKVSENYKRYYCDDNTIMMIAYDYAIRWIDRSNQDGNGVEVSAYLEMLKVANRACNLQQKRDKYCPFNLALRVLFVDKRALSTVKRSRFALALRYAYFHGVEKKRLSGFIYQSGGWNAISHKLKEGQRESGYKEEYDGERLAGFWNVSNADMKALRKKSKTKGGRGRSRRKKKG